VDNGAALSLVPHGSLLLPTGHAIVKSHGGIIPLRNLSQIHSISENITSNMIFFRQMYLNPFLAQIF
jgi:hypothetical protein